MNNILKSAETRVLNGYNTYICFDKTNIYGR